MIAAPEGTGDGAYQMKSADGTEFTVKRIRQYNIMGTGGYYWYNCDYLAKWVINHPELSNILNERNILHEDFSNGILVYAAAFDDIRAAVKASCELVESPSNYLPDTTEFDDDCNYTTESSILEFKTLKKFAECAGFHKSHADSENYVLTRDNENIAFHFSSDDCYVERNGARVSIQGEITQSSGSSVVELTTNDLTDLFGIEFEFDYTNGVANIVNQTDS